MDSNFTIFYYPQIVLSWPSKIVLSPIGNSTMTIFYYPPYRCELFHRRDSTIFWSFSFQKSVLLFFTTIVEIVLSWQIVKRSMADDTMLRSSFVGRTINIIILKPATFEAAFLDIRQFKKKLNLCFYFTCPSEMMDSKWIVKYVRIVLSG
jgi:hypothetical protein